MSRRLVGVTLRAPRAGQTVPGGVLMPVRNRMRAAVLACVLADGESSSAQTSGASPAPPPAPRSAIAIERLFPDDSRRLPKGWTFRFDAPAGCTTCPDRLGVGGVPNGNAPWRVSGALDWQGEKSALGLRVTGQRGARLPLFMTPQTAGPHSPAAASEALLSDSRTVWQLTLNGERIVWTSTDGATLSLFGQAHLPLGTVGKRPRTDDVPALSPRAVLGGFRVRF